MHRVNLMQNSPVQRQAHTRSQTAFTLVELLVVLVIIGMLASMVSFAMFRSMQAAREAKTQALISKLHNVIARHWDTFETGQIPDYINGSTDQEKFSSWLADEMPCTSGEFNQSTLFSNTLGLSVSSADADAQCLYQIVLQLADDDLDRINLFSENETKDLDGDGTPDCFIDGWGKPIGFIREPSGFREWTNPPNDPNKAEIAIPNPSDINDPTAANPLTGATGLYFPLIYSKGPDKNSGLRTRKGPDDEPPGAPKKKDEDDSNEWAADNYETYYLDNIHNHRMNARLQ